MEQNLKSEGKCYFCGKTFSKTGINRHLKAHLQKKAIENTKRRSRSYLVKIETNPRRGNPLYFLSLWIDGRATMEDIDDFLRDIWLECCNHGSAFHDPQVRRQRTHMWMWHDYFETADKLLEQGKIKQYEEMMEEANGDIAMSRKVNNVFHKDLKLEYEYDFGYSTELLLTVIEEYPIKADQQIVLLSRNEPLEWLCDLCGKELATQISTIRRWGEERMFCDECGKKHVETYGNFEEYGALPIVNSPRMGVCLYEGGTIDEERDRIFIPK
jgi:hypothetical protein